MKRSERQEIVRQIIEPYLTAKRDRSLVGEYKRLEPDPEDGRIRTVLSPVITETGRYASGESFVDYSTNLQNLAKEVAFKDPLYRTRDVITADEGKKLLAIDYEKAEAVLVAAESKDWEFLEMILEGHDIHDFHAEQVWGPDFTKAQRHIGKRVTYSSFYLATVATITRKINAKLDEGRVTEKQVKKIHDELLDIHPLEDWWNQVWENLHDPDMYGGDRWLEDCLGFRRKFYNPNDHDRHKEAVNFKAQSGVSSVIDRALIRTVDEVVGELGPEDEFEFLHQVHDELLFQVREDKLEKYLPAVKDIMEEKLEIHGRELYIPIEAELGYRWMPKTGEPDDEEFPGRMEEVDLNEFT